MSWNFKDIDGKDISASTLLCKDGHVYIGREDFDLIITIEDFMYLAVYVIVNTDLVGVDDPRRIFLEWVSRLEYAEGYNASGIRIKERRKKDEGQKG